jgi:hypothetical protein
MQATGSTSRGRSIGAVGSPGRVARSLAAWATAICSHVARWNPCEDTRYLGAARSAEDLERRQRRLERHGNPLSETFLP